MSRRPGVKDWEWLDTSWVLGGRTIGWSNDAVCDLHHARGDDECWFLSWASKPKSMVCQWFGLKTTETVFSYLALKPVVTVSLGLTSKPVATVSPGLASKLVAMSFLVWASKPTATVWWFVSQNHHDDFLVLALKPSGWWFVRCGSKPTGGWDGTGHASRSSSLLHVETSWARVFLIDARHAAPATCTPRDTQTWFSKRNKIKVKPSKCPGFEFKPQQVNESWQSNQGTDHLVSQRQLTICEHSWSICVKQLILGTHEMSTRFWHKNQVWHSGSKMGGRDGRHTGARSGTAMSANGVHRQMGWLRQAGA
jgi:hypothetical protein